MCRVKSILAYRMRDTFTVWPDTYRIDHKMILDVKSPVTFGEVGSSVPKAGVVGVVSKASWRASA
jgi:hypothetical protein